MPASLKKIIDMLLKNDVELQAAAAKIIGELKPKDKRSLKVLISILDIPNLNLKRNVIEALGKIGQQAAMQHLLPYLKNHDLVNTTIQAITNIGSSAVKTIEKTYKRGDLNYKKSIVEILIRLRDSSSIKLLFKIINEGDNHLLECISEAIMRNASSFTAKEKLILKRHLLKNIKKIIKTPNEMIIVIYIKIIGVVQAQETFPDLIKFMDESRSPRIRRNAILSLMVLPFKKGSESKLVKLLLPLLEDKDYPNIVWNVLKILNRYELPFSARPYLIKLLKVSPHRGVKKFAIIRLSKTKHPDAVSAIIDAMWEQDKELRNEALYGIRLSLLSTNIIIERMNTEKDEAKMDVYIDILKNNLSSLKKNHIEKLRKFLFKACDAGSKYSKTLFLLLKQIDSSKFPKYMLERYFKVKKKLNLDAAERIIRLLYDSEFYTEEIKLELTLILIKKDTKVISAEEKIEESEMLKLLKQIISNTKYAIVKSMKSQSNFISKESYYYIGYYFSEKMGREKAFGAEMLRYVIEKYPKTKEAKKAKEKMIIEKIPVEIK